MLESEKALVLSLVHAHIHDNPAYCSFVKGYKTERQTKTGPVEVIVGGHWRRMAMYARMLKALRCTAKFHDISEPLWLFSPLTVTRHRHDEGGDSIPRHARQLSWA